ncbi:hypothetical protein, partial [Rhizobium leguminosarum]|uniref:hypothetical protein n=1 Tax=Rhizobium leguminosarum TaxID=384 RepID=UPI003F9BDB79
ERLSHPLMSVPRLHPQLQWPRFVADIFQQRQLAGDQQLGDLLDQPRFLHLEGNFSDDDLVTAAAEILRLPFRPHAET